MSEFIVMLTRDDKTIPNALEVLDELLRTELQFFGFKDVGLDRESMQELVDRVRAAGRQSVLEVVSLTESDEVTSARVAVELGVDYLVGGTRPEAVAPLLRGTGIKYFPYVGEVIGHPAVLDGSIDSYVEAAKSLRGRVDGINILAYRHVSLNGLDIVKALVENVNLPIISAGSVDSLERVKELAEAGAWGFTIGTALLDDKIVPGAGLERQVKEILTAAKA